MCIPKVRGSVSGRANDPPGDTSDDAVEHDHRPSQNASVQTEKVVGVEEKTLLRRISELQLEIGYKQNLSNATVFAF